MLDTQAFGGYLQNIGLKQFVGVPCSYLAPLINYAINENAFIMANNEGDAVAIASGISLANVQDSKDNQASNYGVVLMQNSGLSNALSPLTSLNYTFKIPILGFVSLRGERDEEGKNIDEPQHELLGVITDKLLHTCKIKYAILDSHMQSAKNQVQEALKILKTKQSFFFIIRDKTFAKVALCNNLQIYAPSRLNHHLFIPNPPVQDSSIKDEKSQDSKGFTQSIIKDSSVSLRNTKSTNLATPPTRLQALEILHTLALDSKAILLASTGKCGRELYEIKDTPNQLYMVGSMGCVSSLALGIALKSRHKVIAIDGDSALLMRLGALSTNAYYAKVRDTGNFCHILLDNQSHDSTGGQFNLSPFVDFASIAESCGYDKVNIAYNLNDFQKYINLFLEANAGGAHFIYLAIKKGSKENLGRPKILPQDVAKRLSNFLSL